MLKKYKKQILVIFGVILVAVLFYLFSEKIIGLLKDTDQLKKKLDQFGIFGYVIFVFLVSLQVIIAIIPGGIYQVAGGYIYGTVLGSVLCLIGCTLGSIVVFLLVRRYGMRLIRIFVSEDAVEKAKFIVDSPKCKVLLTICFIIPGTPKDVISYLAGLTDIALWQWLLICSLGRLPGIWLSVFAGSAFSENRYDSAIWAFLILAVVCGIGLLVYRRISNVEK